MEFLALSSLSKVFFLDSVGIKVWFLIFLMQVSINYLNNFLLKGGAVAEARIKTSFKVRVGFNPRRVFGIAEPVSKLGPVKLFRAIEL